MPFGEIQEAGRWAAPASLRIYLDVVGALCIGLDNQLLRLKSTFEVADKSLESYFGQKHIRHTDAIQGIKS